MEQPALVEVEGLTKHYGEFVAVSGVSFQVAAGEVFALLGPNGAGKTTTLRMLMGILEPTAGTARIAGLDCFRQRAQVMARVGSVPDEPVFYEYLKGREILRFVAEMHGLPAGAGEERWRPLVERLELTDALDEFAANYSKGMRKKLSVVAACLAGPELLILDEPTNGLDPFATRTLHQLVRELAAAGVGVLFSTHLLDQAERLCDRVGIIARGHLAACGSQADLRDELSPGGTLEDVFFAVAGVRADARPSAGPAESGADAGSAQPGRPGESDPPA